MKRLALTSVLMLSLAGIGLALQTTYTLKRSAEVGDEVHYKFSASMKLGDLTLKITGNNAEKVTKVEADGTITLESIQSGVVVEAEDQKLPQDGEDKSTIILSPDRTVKRIEGQSGEDPDAMRLSLVSSLKVPAKAVAVGDEWTAEIPANGKDTRPVKATFKVVAAEKIKEWDCLKISISSKETEGENPAECTGTMWLETQKFVLVKDEYVIKNAPIRMAPTPIDLTISNERVK